MSAEIDSSSNNSSCSPNASTRLPIRLPGQRRTRKACDRCNQLRAKCDGGEPCDRCIQAQTACEFARAMKKRGKPSKVELARRAAQRAADAEARSIRQTTSAATADVAVGAGAAAGDGAGTVEAAAAASSSPGTVHNSTHHDSSALLHYPNDRYVDQASVSVPGSGIHDSYSDLRDLPSLDKVLPPSLIRPNHTGHVDPLQEQNLNFEPAFYPHNPASLRNVHLQYPVLLPLVPYLVSVVPLTFACELLEYYFSSSSTVCPHPQSPYVIGFMFSKHFFLSQDPPRLYSPALLASMLWISSRTSDAGYFDESPSVRERVSRKLLNLTIRLLQPLLHGDISKGLFDHDFSGADGKEESSGLQSRGFTENLDAIVTYMHIGTVVSASEYKSASLRWWNAAWALAVEQQLYREAAPLPPEELQTVASRMSDEVLREERRRVWWLLFLIDRHLSFCYNKPLALSDYDCRNLLQPADEYKWQHGELSPMAVVDPSQPVTMLRPRQKGPPFEFCGAYLFGYYLPLMVILGEVIALIQARNHPRLGQDAVNARFWDEQTRAVSIRLMAFEQSMESFRAESSELAQQAMYERRRSSGHVNADASDVLSRRAIHLQLQQNKAIAYSKYVVHVLYNLLIGKCDPISLFDDQDDWISSPSFIDATSHAIQAAEAIADILDLDPDMSTIPWLFGIELLHGSFLLLLIIDKLKADAAPNVVNAGEIMVRAHEACAFTLSTEYQRKFRRVMRSAIAEARGFVLDEAAGGQGGDEEQKRRREVLGLYRWNRDGTGLAL